MEARRSFMKMETKFEEGYCFTMLLPEYRTREKRKCSWLGLLVKVCLLTLLARTALCDPENEAAIQEDEAEENGGQMKGLGIMMSGILGLSTANMGIEHMCAQDSLFREERCGKLPAIFGADACPDLDASALLDTKRVLLAAVRSALAGGRHLLLTDHLNGAADIEFQAEVFDPAWIDDYYTGTLHSTRPVLLHLGRQQFCLFEEMALGHIDVPIAIVTAGHDNSGSPFNRRKSGYECAKRILYHDLVLRWYITQHSPVERLEHDEKFRILPIGFGIHQPRSGLSPDTYLRALDESVVELFCCPGEGRKKSFFFQCNEESHPLKPRKKVGSDLSYAWGSNLLNRYPLAPNDFVHESMRAFFGISPEGTFPDCFRHYELLFSGNIVIVPDRPFLRDLLEGLPVIFVKDDSWGRVDCGDLREATLKVHQNVGKFRYEKLTAEYWVSYVMQDLQLAGKTWL